MAKLHAGSLYLDYLVLREASDPLSTIIKVEDSDLQWKMYCNDVIFTPSPTVEGFADVEFENQRYFMKYWRTDNPMQFLGFSD